MISPVDSPGVEPGQAPCLDAFTGEREVGRHDADNRIGLIVKRNRFPYDVRVAFKISGPGPKTQHHGGGVPWRVFMGPEGATLDGAPLEHSKELCRNGLR